MISLFIPFIKRMAWKFMTRPICLSEHPAKVNNCASWMEFDASNDFNSIMLFSLSGPLDHRCVTLSHAAVRFHINLSLQTR
jgi:hypothetical protein